MIKINLLGKKKSGIPPQLAFLSQFEKIGLSAELVDALKMPALRLAVLFLCVYAVSYIPAEMLKKDLAALDEKLSALNQRKDQLLSELAQRKDLRKKMDAINKDEADLRRQLAAINALSKDRVTALRALDGVTAILPMKVWLRSVTYSKDQKISLSGNSWEHSPINEYIKAISESTQYTDVQFKGINSESGGTIIAGISPALQKIKAFEVEFRVKSLGEQ